jgi:hypothetical protein
MLDVSPRKFAIYSRFSELTIRLRACTLLPKQGVARWGEWCLGTTSCEQPFKIGKPGTEGDKSNWGRARAATAVALADNGGRDRAGNSCAPVSRVHATHSVHGTQQLLIRAFLHVSLLGCHTLMDIAELLIDGVGHRNDVDHSLAL